MGGSDGRCRRRNGVPANGRGSTGSRFVKWVSTGESKTQVPPLRYAPVGMTILLQGQVFLAGALAGTTELSSRPERTRISCFAVLATTTYAVFLKENRMMLINAMGLYRKSGGA
jgi:hypothetical protein